MLKPFEPMSVKPVLRFIKKRPIVFLSVVALAVILIPYIVSRAVAPSNRVRFFAPNTMADEGELESTSLKFVVFNMAHGRGTVSDNWQGGSPEVRRRRLVKIANELTKHKADVVLLQEVDFDATWSHGINQAEFLANEAGFPIRIEQRNLDFRVLNRTYRFGNAILTKLPVSNPILVDLPSYASWETLVAGKKRALQVDLTWNTQKIRVIAVHLSHRSERIRVKSAELICEKTESSPFPVVIGGDFNSTPTGFPRSNQDDLKRNSIDVFDASLQFARSPMKHDGQHQLTFSTDEPKSIIDWLMIPRSWQFESYKVVDTGLSDHRMIVSEIKIPEQLKTNENGKAEPHSSQPK